MSLPTIGHAHVAVAHPNPATPTGQRRLAALVGAHMTFDDTSPTPSLRHRGQQPITRGLTICLCPSPTLAMDTHRLLTKLRVRAALVLNADDTSIVQYDPAISADPRLSEAASALTIVSIPDLADQLPLASAYVCLSPAAALRHLLHPTQPGLGQLAALVRYVQATAKLQSLGPQSVALVPTVSRASLRCMSPAFSVQPTRVRRWLLYLRAIVLLILEIITTLRRYHG